VQLHRGFKLPLIKSRELAAAQASAVGIGTQDARLPFAKFYAAVLLLLVLNMATLKLPWIWLHEMESVLAESSLELLCRCRYYHLQPQRYFYLITE